MEQDDSSSSESESSSSSASQSEAEPKNSMLAPADEADDEKRETVEEQPTLASQKSTSLVPPPSADSVAQTLRAEADNNRKLLDSLFTSGGDAWERQEVIDSDLEELVQQTAAHSVSNSGPQQDIKMADDDSSNEEGDYMPTQRQLPKSAAHDDEETDTDSSSDEFPAAASAQQAESTTQIHHKSLKEMFKPREEDAGFSLMADLELELELDDEFSLGLQPAPAPAAAAPTSIPTHALVLPTVALPLSATDEWRIDAEAPGLRPMFFPHANAMSVIPTHGFWRTETDEQIRARWEEKKGALTEDWKRRAKEAKKRGRRGGGTGDAD